MSDIRDGLPTSSENESAGFRSSLELLYEIGREVTADLDLRTVLHRVLFLSMKNVGATSGSIIGLDENGQPGESALLILGQTHSHTALQLHVTYEHGMAGWVARNRQAALVPDTRLDERWLQRPEDLENDTPGKSAVSAPILAREKLVGVITLVHPQSGFFTPSHLALVEAIAVWAGTAILHAQLFDRLQSANRRYRELFEDSIEPILITDWQGNILEINRQAQRTIEITAEDLAAQMTRENPDEYDQPINISDLMVVDLEKVGEDLEKLRSGELISYEAALCTLQGTEIPVQVYARSVQTDTDDTRVQWILRDLTERNDLDRLREDLTAMIYHDLRSPLSNIISSLEMLSAMLNSDSVTAGLEDEMVQSMLDIARRSTERIQRLTHSLLDIHRLESGQTIGNRQPVDMHVLVEDALEVVQPAIDNKTARVSVQLDPQLPLVPADADMVRRVLINLLENAVKFGPEQSAIQVAIRRQNGFVVTQVKDSGPGIPLAHQERIFEKFTRVSMKDGPKGLGLGLAYCRLAIAAHGGQIWLESEPGHGSTFSFTLPSGESS